MITLTKNIRDRPGPSGSLEIVKILVDINHIVEKGTER